MMLLVLAEATLLSFSTFLPKSADQYDDGFAVHGPSRFLYDLSACVCRVYLIYTIATSMRRLFHYFELIFMRLFPCLFCSLQCGPQGAPGCADALIVDSAEQLSDHAKIEQ